MTRARRASAVAAAILMTLLWAPLPARADLSLPGQRYQRTDSRIDFGRYADYVTRVHVIRKGDTLGDLAKAHLGSAKRWKEIQALNPALKPEALPAGETLLLPPREAPLAADAAVQAEGPRHWWDLLVVNPPGNHLAHAEHAKDVTWGPYGCWLLAIRHDKLAEFERQLAQSKTHVNALVERLLAADTPWIARTKDQVAGRRSVAEADPVWKIHVERRIIDIAGGVIALQDVRTTWFGRDGKALSAKEVEAARSRWNVLFVALAAAGAVGLWLVLRRRRRDARASSVA